eukprot:7327187-Pyramimonas_sp.AAC.1
MQRASPRASRADKHGRRPTPQKKRGCNSRNSWANHMRLASGFSNNDDHPLLQSHSHQTNTIDQECVLDLDLFKVIWREVLIFQENAIAL